MTTTSQPPDASQATAASPARVLRRAAPRFAAMRAKVTVGVAAEWAARAALLTAAFAALTLLVDRPLRLELPVRAVVLAAFAVVFARLLWTRLCRPWSVRLGDEDLALAVERHDPLLRQSLISAMQFERSLAERLPSESAAMMRAVIGDVGGRLDAVPFAQALDGRRVAKAAAVLAAVVGAFALWGAVDAPSLRLWAMRSLLLSSAEWPRLTRLEFLGAAGAVRLPQGDPLTVRVRASGVVPDQVFVRSVHDDGEEAVDAASSLGDGEFTLTIETLLDDVVLQAEGGDGLSEPLRVQIVERPRIEDLRITVVFPSYMRKPDEELPPTEGEVRIVRGSLLRIAARSKKAVAEPFALLNDKKIPLALRADGMSFGGVVAPDAGGMLVVDVIDEDQLGAAAPPRILVRMVEDKPPVVDFALRGIGPVVTSQVRIPGELKVKDDFGVSRVRAELRLGEDAAPGAEKPTTEAPYLDADPVFGAAPAAGAVRFETTATVDVRRRNKKPEVEDDPENEVRPGMTLSLRFCADDNFGPGAPHTTVGEAFAFRVVTRDKLVEELRRRQVEQREEVVRIRADEQQALLTLRETLSPSSDDPRAAKARLQFKALAARQQALGRRIAHAADLYQRILWEYENNRIWESSKVREYEALTSSPLADLARTAFPQTAHQIGTFADTGDEGLRSSAADGYAEILRRLDAVITIMEQVETLAALIEQLRGVIKVEDSAIREVENRLKAAGESLFNKPKDK